jgi:tetratricopeptide (TPR) repeat protein
MDLIELMERYYDGHLSEEEKASFEQRLYHDELFSEEYELFIKVRQGLESAGEEELRAKLNAADAELPAPFIEHKSNTKITKFFLIAASFAVLIISAYFLFVSDNFSYKHFEERETGLPVLMNSEINNSLDQAMIYYKQKEYEDSYRILNNILEENPSNDTLLYFNGVVLYELENYSEATSYYKEIIDTESAYREKAEYRLALAYLRLDKKNDAKSILRKITSEPTHLYNDKAWELLKEL